MLAAVMTAHGAPLAVRDVPDPALPEDGAVVRVAASGICRTDWHNWLGHLRTLGVTVAMPRILGHEVAGVVEAVGRLVRDVRPGDRVLVPFHLACGRCGMCRSGFSNDCERAAFLGGSVDGGFAERVAVPVADLNCIRLPDEIDDVSGAMLGCRYMTAYHALTLQGELQPGWWVAVIGAGGGAGLSAVQLARVLGGRPIAIDRDPSKLAQAEAEGAAATVDASQSNVVEAVRDLTGGGVPLVVSMVSSPETIANGLRMLNPRGRLVVVGLTNGEDGGSIGIPMDLVVARELEIRGTSGNPHHRYDGLLRLVASGACEPRRLLAEECDLGGVTGVLERMSSYETSGFSVVTQFASD